MATELDKQYESSSSSGSSSSESDDGTKPHGPSSDAPRDPDAPSRFNEVKDDPLSNALYRLLVAVESVSGATMTGASVASFLKSVHPSATSSINFFANSCPSSLDLDIVCRAIRDHEAFPTISIEFESLATMLAAKPNFYVMKLPILLLVFLVLNFVVPSTAYSSGVQGDFVRGPMTYQGVLAVCFPLHVLVYILVLAIPQSRRVFMKIHEGTQVWAIALMHTPGFLAWIIWTLLVTSKGKTFSNDTSITLIQLISSFLWTIAMLVCVAPQSVDYAPGGKAAQNFQQARLALFSVKSPHLASRITSAEDLVKAIDPDTICLSWRGGLSKYTRVGVGLLYFIAIGAAITITLWVRPVAADASPTILPLDWLLYVLMAIENGISMFILVDFTVFTATAANRHIVTTLRKLTSMLTAEEAALNCVPYVPVCIENNDAAILAVREFFLKYYFTRQLRRSGMIVGGLLFTILIFLVVFVSVIFTGFLDVLAIDLFILVVSFGLASVVAGSFVYANETISSNSMAIDRAISLYFTHQEDLSSSAMQASMSSMNQFATFVRTHETKLGVFGIPLTQQTVLVIRTVLASGIVALASSFGSLWARISAANEKQGFE